MNTPLFQHIPPQTLEQLRKLRDAKQYVRVFQEKRRSQQMTQQQLPTQKR